MAKKCVSNNVIDRDASVQATKTILEIEASYDNVFGLPLNQAPLVQGSLKSLMNKLGELKLKRKTAIAKKQPKVALRHKKDIAKAEQDIKDLKRKLKESPKQLKLLNDIKNIFVKNLQSYADKQAYDINPRVYFPTIRDFLLERYGVLPDSNASINDLVMIKKRIGKILEEQKINDKEPGIPLLKRQHQDPAMLMLKQDPTSLGFSLVNKTREAPNKIFGVVNKYNNRMKVISGALKDWITNNNYLFNVDIPLNMNIGHDEKAKSFDNIIKFAFDVMDGRAKYIIPKPIGGNKKENADFIKDKSKYETIVKRNIFDQINEGGEIQKLTTAQGQTFYYVTIKQDPDNHNGREVYYAYQVVHKPGKDKEGAATKDFLMLPRSTKKGPKGKASRQDFDTALGQEARLASYTNQAGQSIQGRMKDGWYQANTYVPLQGVKKHERYGMVIEREFNVYSYSSYRHNDTINNTNDPNSSGEIPESFWNFIYELRLLLKDFHTYMVNENKATESQRKEIISILKQLPNERMNVASFDQYLREALAIDGVRSNMSIDNKGNIITSNTSFGELYNYIMWRYTPSDLIRGHILAREGLLTKIADINADIEISTEKLQNPGLTPEESLKLNSRITGLQLDLQDLDGLKKHFDEMIDVSTGQITIHDTERLNQVQMIAAAQHRKGFLNPFPTYDDDGNQLTMGRLATLDVFADYFYESARVIEHNNIRNDLMNAIGNVSEGVAEYLLNHVKATFGQVDTEAGAFGLDYSNPKVAAKLEKFMKTFRGDDYQFTDRDLHTIARMNSMFISGNLLQLGSTMNNHWQRLSVYIESVYHDFSEGSRIWKGINPNTGRSYADEIAEASGATEVTVGLADSLLGAMSDEVSFGTGWFSKQDLLTLQLSKRDFLNKVKKSETWRSFFTGLIERQLGKNKATAKQLENIYDGTWELINGIEKGSLNKKQLKGIQKNFEGILQQELINQYASWGLKGGYLSGTFAKTGLDKFLTFSGVEEQMRKWTAVQFAVQAVNNGQVPQEVIDNPQAFGYSSPYVHPNALKMARIGNNITMFGLSPQYLPLMFRGGVGALLWKFKPYQWHQGRREMITMINYWDSLPEKDRFQNIKDTLQLMIPPIFGLPGRGKKLISAAHEKIRRFIWARVLMSIVSTPTVYMPGVSELYKLVRRIANKNAAYGAGMRAMERGGESVIASSALKAMMLLALVGGFINPNDEEEEDQIWQDSARWFLPMYVNIAIEFFMGRPMNAIRAYSQSAYRLANWTADALGFEGED